MQDRSAVEASRSQMGLPHALKLFLVVILALTLWQAAQAVNASFQSHEIVTATPFVRGSLELILGVGTTQPFVDRVRDFWFTHHRTIALALLCLATLGLTARCLALGRIVDFLFFESLERARRGVGSFLLNGGMLVLEAGALLGVVTIAAGSDAFATPIPFIILMVINILWLAGVLLAARASERRALRGLQHLLVTSLAAAALCFAVMWWREGLAPLTQGPDASEAVVITACVALALCIGEAGLLGKVYCCRQRVPAREAGSGV